MDESEKNKDIISEEKEVINPEIAEKALKKMNKNPWMFASIALGVLLIVSLFVIFNDGAVSSNTAGQIILDFANTQTGGGVELVGVEEVSGLYEVNVLYQGQELPLYITKDGKTLVQGVMALEEVEAPVEQQPAVTEPVKSDRPQVDLFIWGYCPYGVQAQGPLAEVASLLGDSADFRAVMYYDGHGAYETQQNKIGACIQKLAPEKYWEYAAGFVSDVYPTSSQARDVETDKTLSISVMDDVGIDSDEVMTCVESEGADLIAVDSAYAQANGVTGSPTLMINGVITQTARTADAYKTAVCASFNNAPEACGETLDSDTTAASGSC